MTLDELLEQFDEVLDSGIKIPGKKSVVDIEKLRAVVDDIRLNIPSEIKQARGIVADRADIITTAKREADGIIRAAERFAKEGYHVIITSRDGERAEKAAKEIAGNVKADTVKAVYNKGKKSNRA